MQNVHFLDTVSLSYTATLTTGEIIDAVPEDKPLTLAIGSGRILKAAEVALVGLEPGQSRTVSVLPEDAYGPYYSTLVQDLPRSSFADHIDPIPGMVLSLTYEKDKLKQEIPATVLAADANTVTVDFNHPLAGKTIVYTLKLHAIGR